LVSQESLQSLPNDLAKLGWQLAVEDYTVIPLPFVLQA
jgi:hypothetical protein